MSLIAWRHVVSVHACSCGVRLLTKERRACQKQKKSDDGDARSRDSGTACCCICPWHFAASLCGSSRRQGCGATARHLECPGPFGCQGTLGLPLLERFLLCVCALCRRVCLCGEQRAALLLCVCGAAAYETIMCCALLAGRWAMVGHALQLCVDVLCSWQPARCAHSTGVMAWLGWRQRVQSLGT